MGGKKKRQYGTFNVQGENARGKVHYTTPQQQVLFLIQKIQNQENQKSRFFEQQREEQLEKARREAAARQNAQAYQRQNQRQAAQARSSLIEEEEANNNNNNININININVSNNPDNANDISSPEIPSQNAQNENPEQLFSQQYSQIIGDSQQRSVPINQPDISFDSYAPDLTTYPVRAQGRSIFERSQSSFRIKQSQTMMQAKFMMEKFKAQSGEQRFIMKPGPSFEEFFSTSYQEQQRQQNQQQINLLNRQVNQFMQPEENHSSRDQNQNQDWQSISQSLPGDILSIRSSQQSQGSDPNQISSLIQDQFQSQQVQSAVIVSQESIQEIQQLEDLQNSLISQGMGKKNQKKKQKLQEIHRKFQSKYKQYQQALELNPEIADFNLKELRQHFSEPRIQYIKKLKVIQKRFGSCKANEIDFGNKRTTIKEIAKELGLKYFSVVTIIRRFRLQKELKTVKKCKIKKQTKMSKFNFSYILDPEILREWAPFSLEKRCELIRQKSDVKISRVTLANYYKQHGINYRKPAYTIHSTKTAEELQDDRQQFITTIVDYYHKNLEIIYIDECSTHLWEKKNKIWAPKENNVNIQLPVSRKESVTVIGAISSHNDKLYYCFGNSTNREDILFFFEGLNSDQSDLRLKGKVVVLDNHSAHITKEIRDYIQSQGATILFLPVASSYFNPIETMWAWIKSKWRKKLIEPKDYNPGKEYLLRELQKICDTVPPHVVRHISAHCFKILKEYIEEKLLIRYL